MNDKLLERLGDYFVSKEIRVETGFTFEQFVGYYLSGQWRDLL